MGLGATPRILTSSLCSFRLYRSSILRRLAQERSQKTKAHEEAVRRRKKILSLGTVSRKDHAKALQHARANRMRLLKENERKERLQQAQRTEIERQNARAHAQRYGNERSSRRDKVRNVAVQSSLFDPHLPLSELQVVSCAVLSFIRLTMLHRKANNAISLLHIGSTKNNNNNKP